METAEVVETPAPVEAPVEAPPAFDMAGTVEKVSAKLNETIFRNNTPEKTEEPTEKVTGPLVGATVTPVAETPAVTPPGPDVPKSWTKEMQPHWAKLPPEIQAYWQTREQQMEEGQKKYLEDAQFSKPLKAVLAPFEPMVQAAGLTVPQAIQNLFQAQQRLTQGTPQSRQQAYDELGRELKLQTAGSNGTPPPPVDPAIQSLQQQMAAMDADLRARQQQEQKIRLEQSKKEVNAFAADPAHPYFDEVSNEIMIFLEKGLSLDEAYKKAVGANPVTFEKELQARLLTEQAKQKENARLDALPKVKAAQAHVKGTSARRTPAEPLGTMEDTLKATLADIRSRAH